MRHLGQLSPNSGAEVYVINKIDQVTTRGTIGMASIYNPLAGQTQQYHLPPRAEQPALDGSGLIPQPHRPLQG